MGASPPPGLLVLDAYCRILHLFNETLNCGQFSHSGDLFIWVVTLHEYDSTIWCRFICIERQNDSTETIYAALYINVPMLLSKFEFFLILKATCKNLYNLIEHINKIAAYPLDEEKKTAQGLFLKLPT